MLCSCKLRLRRAKADGRLTQRPSSSSWSPSALRRRGQDLQLQGPGRIAEFMLCSCKLRLRRASPTVGLPRAHRALLGLRRLYAGGAKTDSYRARGGSPNSCSVAASYASAGASPTVGLPSAHRALLGLRRLYAGGAKTDSYRGRGGSPNSCSVAGSYASAGQARR